MGDKTDIDPFEKLFGKQLDRGYAFIYTQVSVGWRAICISWGAQGIGFGEIAIYFDKKKVKIDTECMGKAFCDALVEEAIKKLKIEEDNNPPTIEELEGGWCRQNINSSFLRYMYDCVTWEKSQKGRIFV